MMDANEFRKNYNYIILKVIIGAVIYIVLTSPLENGNKFDLVIFLLFLFLALLYSEELENKKLTKEWLLDIVSELDEKKIKISGKLINDILPIYKKYQKYQKAIYKRRNKIEKLNEKLTLSKQELREQEDTVQMIKNIRKEINRENSEVDSIPRIKKIKKKIEKKERIFRRYESKYLSLMNLEETQIKVCEALENETKKIISDWVCGIRKSQKVNVEKKISEEMECKNEIKCLISETEEMIENAILNTKDSEKLMGFKFLQTNILTLSQNLENGEFAYEEIKIKILGYKEEIEILALPLSNNNEIFPDNKTRQNDPYYILGVDSSLTKDGIKKAYHKKIHEYYPDKFDNQQEWVKIEAEKMTKSINEAYSILKKRQKR